MNLIPNCTVTFRALAIITLLSLSACTNSKMIISPLYNRLDNQIRDEFNKLGDFSKDQQARFEQRISNFHVWHRQSELPKYAALLQSLAQTLRTNEKSDLPQVQQWINTAEQFSKEARECHPANFALSMVQELSDDQINFIERRFASERKRNIKKYESKTADERRKQRVKDATKWAHRMGLELNSQQKSMLDEAFAAQTSMHSQYYKLVARWSRDLFKMARNQESSHYAQQMQTQVSRLWTLLEKTHPDQWQANRELWEQFGVKFFNSLSYDQRIQTANWMSKMSDTLSAIAKETPPSKATLNPELGCYGARS